MKLNSFLQRWDTLIAENRFHRGMLLLCIAIIFVLAFVAAEKEQRVILQPVTLSKTAWVDQQNASINYFESWGTYLALLMGNIHPGNLNYIRERLEPLLDSGIYNEVVVRFNEEAQNIKENGATFNFEPRRTVYDRELGRVFVNGFSYVKGPISRPQRVERTYEYQLQVDNYLPKIVFMDTYEGQPRDSVYLSKQKKVKDDA